MTSVRIMFSYLKPESVRQYPDATVRPWAICQVAEDALSFASALGYVYALVLVDLCSRLTYTNFTPHVQRRRAQIYKNGYAFRRGHLLIQMFQQEQVSLRVETALNYQLNHSRRYLGRSSYLQAYTRTRGHAMGSGGEDCFSLAAHARKPSQSSGRSRTRSTEVYERSTRLV